MKKTLFLTILTLTASLCCLRAQTDSVLVAPEGYRYVDSLIYIPAARYNESLMGKDIFEIMPQGVTVNQSEELRAAAELQIEASSSNRLETDGYRIRIYFDNRQDAREASEKAQERSKRLFPGYSTYRTYIYPNFKVTVGDFRTKAEAQIALKEVARYFPSAFVVKERMKFPSITQDGLYTVDTLKVLVPVDVPESAAAVTEGEK